jgi:hypothetical protein
LSTNGDQTSRIEPLKAIRGSGSPDERAAPANKATAKQKPSAAGSEKHLLDQMKELENLGDKDLFRGVVDQLQRLSALSKNNMKPIKLTQFDVRE